MLETVIWMGQKSGSTAFSVQNSPNQIMAKDSPDPGVHRKLIRAHAIGSIVNLGSMKK